MPVLRIRIFSPGSITRTLRAAVAAALLLAGAPLGSAEPWRDAPEFTRVFAPVAHRESYRASVSPAQLEAVLAGLADDPDLVRTPGAWTARLQPALDAFGRSGTYDRWKLARLYGARQPRVARGARMEGGRIAESWTLLSPYPSGDFTRLEPGTLRLVVRIP
jgi:hypothetical protein